MHGAVQDTPTPYEEKAVDLKEHLSDAVLRRPASSATDTRADLVLVGLGLWLVSGVFVDGWAHVNKTSLETFFTPWHGLLYSGAAAVFGYVALVARRAGGVPPGYGAALVGGPLFLLAGAGDFLWHQVFGIEVGLDALLSPTHLVLLASGLLVLSTAWRADTARGPAASVAGVLSLVLTTTLAAFFLLYTSAFTTAFAAMALARLPEGAPGHEQAELPAVAGVSAYLVTTLLLLVPLLLMTRRQTVPRGSATALLVLVAGASAAVTQFEQPLLPLAALLAGVVLDTLLLRTRSASGRTRALVAALALPLALWPLQLIGVAVVDAVRWPVELWSGVVVLSAGVAVAIAHLAAAGPADASTPALSDRPSTDAGRV